MAKADPTLSLVCAVYSLLLLFVGTIGNIIVFLKFLKRPYLLEPTFILLAFLRFADIACQYEWNLKHILVPFFNINYEWINLSLCRFSVFMQLFSLKLSAWILVTVICERCLKILIANWRKCYMNATKALILGMFVLFTVFIIDMPSIIVNGYYENVNGTKVLRCYDSKYFKFFPLWQQLHSFIYSFIPSALLILPCAYLLYHKFRRDNSDDGDGKSQSKFSTIDLRIVIMAILFIIASVPSSVIGYYYESVSKTESGQNAILMTDQLLFSYHAFNFLLFLFICKHKGDNLVELENF